MTVLYVTHYSDLLGANRSMIGLLSHLRKDVNPIVLLPREGDLSEHLNEMGIQCIIIRYFPSVHENNSISSSMMGLVKEMYNICISFFIVLSLRRYNIKLVHSNSSVVNIGAYLAFLLRIPHVWHFREFAKLHYNVSYNLGDSLQKIIWRYLSDRVICTSKAIEIYFSNLLKKGLFLSTIYNGVKIDSVMSHSLKQTDIFNIALVGVLHPGKHQDIVLKAITHVINEDHINNFVLHIYGQGINPQYEDALYKLTELYQIQDYVIFHGYDSDVKSSTRDCQIGILASEHEAFGRVTIEYMDNGMIPVVSNSGANVEIVKDGVNGFIFKLNDDVDLAHCVTKVIKSYHNLQYMLDNIFTTSLKYSVESNANNIMTLYDSI